MRYWEDQKLTFFHVPKVAGTSVSTLLDDHFGRHKMPNGPHLTIRDANNNQLRPKGHSEFAIIRNPYERAVSYYEWFKTDPNDRFYPEKAHVVGRSFEEWVRDRYLQDTAAQEEFIDENITILKIESLNEDLDNYFNNKLNLSVNVGALKHIYKTRHVPFIKHPDVAEIEHIIYEKESWVFKRGFYERLRF